MRNHHSIEPDQPTQRPNASRFIPLGVLAGLSTIVLLAGGGAAWWTWQSITSKAPSPSTEEANIPASPYSSDPESSASTNSTEQMVQVYWLQTLDTGIEPVPSSITVQGDEPETILSAAFEKMLEGTSEPDLTSTIPAGTTLQNLDIENDGVHINLSQEFTTGGGSTSMLGRLAQVVYTATTLNPDAPVWISVEGQPLEALGGEGILVEQPMTRNSFEQNFQL
jgi:spore germination protein GerM